MSETIGKVIFSIGLAVSSLFGFNSKIVESPQLGSSFVPVQGSNYTLSGAGVTSSATTIQLTSFTLPDPAKTLITMSMFGDIGYAVIEPQTSKIETITFTGVTQNANGTALLTGVTRGIGFVDPYTGSASRALSHAGGAYLILSNPAAFYGQQFVFKNQIGTSTAVLIYSSTTPPRLDSVAAQAAGTFIATTSEFATITYVNRIAVAGCATSSSSVTGCVRLGTQVQSASSTFSAGAPSVLTTQFSTSTPGSGCGLCIPISLNSGKLSPLWLNGTAENYIFNASTTMSATSTVAASNVLSRAWIANLIAYAWPSTRGASSTVLTENGSGTLVWNPIIRAIIKDGASYSTSATATTTLASYTLPANSIGINGTFRYTLYVTGAGANDNKFVQIRFGTGLASTSIAFTEGFYRAGGSGTGGSITGTIRNLNSASSQIGYSQGSSAGDSITAFPSAFYIGTTTAYNTAGQLYMSIDARVNNASDSVTLQGFTLEVIP